MNYKINFSNDFIDSLQSISVNYLYFYAHQKEKFQKEFLEKIRNVRMFPEMYPKIIDTGGLRKIVMRQYITIYHIKNNIIYFDDIIHEKSKIFNNQD